MPLRVQKDLLFCQVVRLSFSNLPQQLAFPDVNVDAVSIISFLRRQKIADVFFSFSPKFERKTSDLPTWLTLLSTWFMNYTMHVGNFLQKKSWNRKAATKSSPKSISLMFSAKCSLFLDSFKVNQINWYSSNILKA